MAGHVRLRGPEVGHEVGDPLLTAAQLLEDRRAVVEKSAAKEGREAWEGDRCGDDERAD